MKHPLKTTINRIVFWRRQEPISAVLDDANVTESSNSEKTISNEGIINIAFESEDGPLDNVVVQPEFKCGASASSETVDVVSDAERQQWANPVEFLLSCIAMSVGLGNIWRFPFTAYENGGGAFLIPYIIVLLFIGKPLYYMELCMGQFSSSGPVKVWDLAPAFRGIGYGQLIATWCVVTYYASLVALTVYYFFASFSSILPWSECDLADWATPQCVGASENVTGRASAGEDFVTSSEEYFENVVLHLEHQGLDNGISPPLWDLSLCLLFSWIVLFLVLARGVQSSGKVSYFTALFPYIVLFILLGRGLSLPGAFEGVKYFITPEWHKLLKPEVWFAAVGQSFFSLSVGFGSITMFSSYNKFTHNVYRDAVIISITDTLTSLLAGFTIFAVLGHLQYQLGSPIGVIIKGGGTTLAFVSYPDVLARFTWCPQLFSVLFFLMLFTLGIGSASALTGCVATIICDAFPTFKKWIVTLVVCLLGFLFGLFYVTPQGQHILTLVDYYGGSFIIFMLAILEVIAVQWVYGVENFCRDVKFMLNRDTGIYWKFCWAVFIPIALMIIFFYAVATAKPITFGSYVFSAGANAFGIFLAVFATLMVPAFFGVSVYRRLKLDFSINSILTTFKPNSRWGPKNANVRKKYDEMIQLHKKHTKTTVEKLSFALRGFSGFKKLKLWKVCADCPDICGAICESSSGASNLS